MLDAGAAQGVTMESRYTVHSSNLISDLEHHNPSLGTLIISEVSAFSSELSYIPGATAFPIPRLFYCRLQTRVVEKFALYTDDRAWLETVLPSHDHRRLSVDVVDGVDTAALCLSVVKGKVHFARNDRLIMPHIGSRLPHVIDHTNTDVIREIIGCAMHFNYHLTRTGGDNFKNVHMELRRLKMDYTPDFDQNLTPFGDNIIEKEPAILVIDETARLGMTILNRTDLALYPYLFYFDPSDLEISAYNFFFWIHLLTCRT